MSTALPAEVLLRRMSPDDVDRVEALETENFSIPWKASTFISLLERDPVEAWVVVEGHDEILGYAVLWCIQEDGEIANIAIRKDRRGKGLGSALLARLLEVAQERGVCHVFLEVRPSNTAAGALYEAHGFEEIAVRSGYYDQPKEDARVLRKILVSTSPTSPSEGGKTGNVCS